MKQLDKTNGQAKGTRQARNDGNSATARKVQKEWAVRLELRLPHKIGQPLGSSSSCDGSSAV